MGKTYQVSMGRYATAHVKRFNYCRGYVHVKRFTKFSFSMLKNRGQTLVKAWNVNCAKKQAKLVNVGPALAEIMRRNRVNCKYAHRIRRFFGRYAVKKTQLSLEECIAKQTRS